MPVFPGFHHILQYCTLYCTAPVCRWTRKPGPWLMQRILSETFAKKYYIIFSKLEKATHLAWRRGAAASGNSVRLGRPSAESRVSLRVTESAAGPWRVWAGGVRTEQRHGGSGHGFPARRPEKARVATIIHLGH